MGVCLFANTITLEPFEISSWFFGEQDMARSSDKFENGNIPTHCGARWWLTSYNIILIWLTRQYVALALRYVSVLVYDNSLVFGLTCKTSIHLISTKSSYSKVVCEDGKILTRCDSCRHYWPIYLQRCARFAVRPKFRRSARPVPSPLPLLS